MDETCPLCTGGGAHGPCARRGQVITVGNERFRCPEALFNPAVLPPPSY